MKNNNTWQRIEELVVQSDLENSLSTELQRKRKGFSDSRTLVVLINEIARIRSGSTKLKATIIGKYKEWGMPLPDLTHEKLKRAHVSLSRDLKNYYSNSEAQRTYAEKNFCERWQRNSKRKIYPSTWIGNNEIDGFVASARGANFRGIAYQIDGGIHNEDGKRRKDEYTEKYLHEQFGILTIRIDNPDVNRKILSDEIRRIENNVPNLDSRSRKNLWNDIYVETIACCYDTQAIRTAAPFFLQDLLRINESQIRWLLTLIEAKKHGQMARISKQNFISTSILPARSRSRQFLEGAT